MAKISINTFSGRGDAIAYYLAMVDRHAEASRSAYITPGPGQAMTYETKHREALAGHGPLIQAEADALCVNVQHVAQSVLEARQRWEKDGAKIEALRVRAKRDIRQTDTPQSMHQIAQRFRKNLPA